MSYMIFNCVFIIYSYDYKDQPEKWNNEKLDVMTFRQIIVSQLHDRPDLVTVYDIPEDWYETMKKDGTYCDYYFQSLTADYLERDIILVSAFSQDGHDEDGKIVIESKNKNEEKEDLYLLYYHGQHFQSIRPKE